MCIILFLETISQAQCIHFSHPPSITVLPTRPPPRSVTLRGARAHCAFALVTLLLGHPSVLLKPYLLLRATSGLFPFTVTSTKNPLDIHAFECEMRMTDY